MTTMTNPSGRASTPTPTLHATPTRNPSESENANANANEDSPADRSNPGTNRQPYNNALTPPPAYAFLPPPAFASPSPYSPPYPRSSSAPAPDSVQSPFLYHQHQHQVFGPTPLSSTLPLLPYAYHEALGAADARARWRFVGAALVAIAVYLLVGCVVGLEVLGEGVGGSWAVFVSA